MKCSLRALIILGVAIASVHSYGPVRTRPLRRSPPSNWHVIVSRRDPAYLPGPPYSKRPMNNMMISRPGSRPKKHVTAQSGPYPKYSPVYKYPPPPHSRPFSSRPPSKKNNFYPRPYGPPSKYPYYGKHPGYPSPNKRPKIPYEPDIPNETIATFVNSPSSSASLNHYKGNNKVPTITYGTPNIASKPYNLYGGSSSEEDTSSGSSEEVYQGTHHVGASIKYGKNTPGNSPTHPSFLDPATNIKYPGPTFKFPPQTADTSYHTIVNPTQSTKYNGETSQVKYPTAEGSQSSTYRKRRPQRQDASKATQAVISRPYSTSNVKFPAANNGASDPSYQNYDHFLQETFAPDLSSGNVQQTQQHQQQQSDNSQSGYTRPKSKDRSKSRYRTPAKQHYEVRDEPEERGDTYDDIETVDTDYEGWQPSDTK